MNEKINQWLAFLDDKNKEAIKMAEKKNATLKKARIEMNYLTGNAEVRRLAELREKWEMDYISGMDYAEKEGIKKGIKKGVKEGVKEGKNEIAKEMIKRGMETKVIIELTGLTEEELRKLIQKQTNHAKQ